ncbi:MAG: hypothetical protein ABI614_04240 [Planctomycetota bacterium]
MMWTILKVFISAAVIVAVAEVAGRFPRLGALLLTLPIVSIMAFIMTWTKEGEMTTITQLARETLVLVPLGLPFFIPFALSNRTGLSFWPSFVVGVLLASITIGLWFRFGPSPPASPVKETSDVSGADANGAKTIRG